MPLYVHSVHTLSYFWLFASLHKYRLAANNGVSI